MLLLCATNVCYLFNKVIPHRVEAVYRNANECKTANSVKLAREEGDAAFVGALSEVLVKSYQSSNSGSITANKTRNGATSVCDFEISAICLISGRGTMVVSGVSLARGSGAFRRRYLQIIIPQVVQMVPKDCWSQYQRLLQKSGQGYQWKLDHSTQPVNNY